MSNYVEEHDGGYWVSGTRVSLDSIVHAYLQGLSAETIARECFRTLSLEQVYGAITYYLANRAAIDDYLKQADAEFEALRHSAHAPPRSLIEKLHAAREQAARREIMKLRFQADADLNEIIVSALLRREPAIDFRTANESAFHGRDDPYVLSFATDSGRVLVSHDRKTMPKHFSDFVATRQSPGVFIVPQNLPIADAVEELLLIWAASEADEWTNVFASLPL